MYRLYGALVVLAIVAILSGSSFWVNTSAAAQVTGHLQEAYHSAETGDSHISAQHIRQAADMLQEYRQILCLFVSHRTIDSIEQTVAQAEICLRQKEIQPFLLYCRSAMDMTEDFSRLEYPYLHNII